MPSPPPKDPDPMVMLTVRVPIVVRDALRTIATRTGTRPSDVHRRMLAEGIRRTTGGAVWTNPDDTDPTASTGAR